MDLSDDVRAHLKGFLVTEAESPLVTEPAEIFAAFPPGRRLDVDEAAFLAWVAEADYERAGPSWWSQFHAMHLRKMLEHYVSIELAGIRAGGTYMDAAASASPFYEVVRRTHGAATCYRQDLNRAPGVRGDTIGSDASNIPLPDASLDGIVTHNSWEHFEGDSALGFLRECARLLRPGGRLCVVPMNFRRRTEIWTAPSCWASKYARAPELPRFDPRAAIVIREETVQRQVMWWAPEELAAELRAIPELDVEMVQVVCMGKSNYALVATRR